MVNLVYNYEKYIYIRSLFSPPFFKKINFILLSPSPSSPKKTPHPFKSPKPTKAQSKTAKKKQQTIQFSPVKPVFFFFSLSLFFQSRWRSLLFSRRARSSALLLLQLPLPLLLLPLILDNSKLALHSMVPTQALHSFKLSQPTIVW